MDNLIIRAASPTDAAGMAEVFGQPRAMWGTLQMPYPTPELWRKRLESTALDTILQLVAELDGMIVGSASLHWSTRARTRHVAGIGMAVHDAYAGRGIGSRLLQALLAAADDWHNFLRVELEVFPDNERAIKLYERCGFVHEGRKQKAAFRDGQYVDVLMMGRIRPERPA